MVGACGRRRSRGLWCPPPHHARRGALTTVACVLTCVSIVAIPFVAPRSSRLILGFTRERNRTVAPCARIARRRRATCAGTCISFTVLWWSRTSPRVASALPRRRLSARGERVHALVSILFLLLLFVSASPVVVEAAVCACLWLLVSGLGVHTADYAEREAVLDSGLFCLL